MMSLDIKLHGFLASQDEKGNWIYKADDKQPLKKDGTLKAEYKDLPRYKVLIESEKKIQDQYSSTLELAVRTISSKVKSLKPY